MIIRFIFFKFGFFLDVFVFYGYNIVLVKNLGVIVDIFIFLILIFNLVLG